MLFVTQMIKSFTGILSPPSLKIPLCYFLLCFASFFLLSDSCFYLLNNQPGERDYFVPISCRTGRGCRDPAPLPIDAIPVFPIGSRSAARSSLWLWFLQPREEHLFPGSADCCGRPWLSRLVQLELSEWMQPAPPRQGLALKVLLQEQQNVHVIALCLIINRALRNMHRHQSKAVF